MYNFDKRLKCYWIRIKNFHFSISYLIVQDYCLKMLCFPWCCGDRCLLMTYYSIDCRTFSNIWISDHSNSNCTGFRICIFKNFNQRLKKIIDCERMFQGMLKNAMGVNCLVQIYNLMKQRKLPEAN